MSYGPIIDPDFFDREAVIDMQTDDESRSALLVLFELMVFSMAARTDGRIKRNMLRKATMHGHPEDAMALLVKRGLATETPEGWQINWDRQKSAEWVAKKQKDGADWDRHIHGNHVDCADHPGYKCHQNGDYAKWCAENLGDLDGGRDGDHLGNPNITQPNSTELNVVKSEVERGEEFQEKAVTASSSEPAASSDSAPAQEDDSEPPKPRPRKVQKPKVVLTI
ncbi:hypothetical protein [Rhodococcoides fascians]|uniref:hypothetical protein n=1 Tax=Rhodococcoides fascians TaxID=1828 RepID=UPI0012D2EB0C|nr:hypothetical protein [Rhodococcus fascians]